MGELISRLAELVNEVPSLVEAGFRGGFCLGPCREGGLDGGGYGGEGSHCVKRIA